MRNDNKKITGTLYGVGIGPGDPKLLTIRAKEILNKVDMIFVPKAKDDARSCARMIVEAATSKSKNFAELTFPMTNDMKKLKSHWLAAAGRIVRELKRGRSAAFVTIGDPFIYSTYIYLLGMLRKHFPEIAVETIPGITAFNAASAAGGLALVKRNERMAVVPVTKGLKYVREALRKYDTVVLMKVGSKLGNVLKLLKKMRLIKNGVLVSHVGQVSESIVRDLSSLKDKRSGYLSVIIVKRKMDSV